MIQVISAHYEMYLCPMVIAGRTADDSTIYARYRWGHLSVRIDPRENPPFGGAQGTWIYSEQIGGEYDGWIDYELLRLVRRAFIEWPDTLDDPPAPSGEPTSLLVP